MKYSKHLPIELGMWTEPAKFQCLMRQNRLVKELILNKRPHLSSHRRTFIKDGKSVAGCFQRLYQPGLSLQNIRIISLTLPEVMKQFFFFNILFLRYLSTVRKCTCSWCSCSHHSSISVHLCLYPRLLYLSKLLECQSESTAGKPTSHNPNSNIPNSPFNESIYQWSECVNT